jgi:leader peptidase (prepilin peptidase)/N-methyltransferase
MHMGGAAGLLAVILGVGIAAVSFHALPTEAALVSCVLGWAMLAIAAIDARRFTIPDVLSLPAIVLGLLASGSLLEPSHGRLVGQDHVIGALLGGAGFWLVREAYARLRGREGLGLGDVKLAAAAGAWTGWNDLPNVVLLAATMALGLATALAIVRGRSLMGAERIAFGAFLAPSVWIVWMLRQLLPGL